MELLTNVLRVAARLRISVDSTVRGAAALAALCIVLAPGVARAQDESLEYAVKAAYLSKFGLYVEWPRSAFPSPDAPINLCIAGEDPFGATIDEAASGQRIADRAIVIRRLKVIGRDSGCHILYIAGSDPLRTGQFIDTVRGSGVLTVSDARGPGAVSAIINFVIKDNRMRFNIDEEAAAQNGLAISSKLLSLALNVKQRQPNEAR